LGGKGTCTDVQLFVPMVAAADADAASAATAPMLLPLAASSDDSASHLRTPPACACRGRIELVVSPVSHAHAQPLVNLFVRLFLRFGYSYNPLPTRAIRFCAYTPTPDPKPIGAPTHGAFLSRSATCEPTDARTLPHTNPQKDLLNHAAHRCAGAARR
jgi:hypothetical protein